MADLPVWQQPERTLRLAEIDIFADLSEPEMARIAAAAPMHDWPAKHVIFSPHESREVLFILKKGRVRSYQIGPDGRSLTTAIHEPGDIFGAMVPLGQRMDDTWAETLEPCVVCVMARDDVQTLLLADPRIAERIATKLGDRVVALERRLSDTVLRSVPARIASALAAMAGRSAGTATLKLTHEQLADLVGTTRETTTRVLGELSERSLVQLRRGRIVVRDAAGLRALADDEHTDIRTR